MKFSLHCKFVHCVVCFKQAQRLQLCLHDINATMMSKKWEGSYNSGPKYRIEWRWLSHGCGKMPMDQHANRVKNLGPSQKTLAA